MSRSAAALDARGYLRERSVALQAARAAARVLRSRFESGVRTEWKGPGDVVTEADRTAEARVREVIAASFPDDAVVGEEGSADLTEAQVDGRRRWYVDPLDGTVNFTKGRPRWAVSVAFCDTDDAVAAAAIVVPPSAEELTASRGAGAWRGDRRLRVADDVGADEALLLLGPAHGALGQRVPDLGRVTLTLRVTGSTVADLGDVAVGRADAYVANGQGRWDVAAGSLVCTEAGLTVTDLSGRAVPRPTDELLVAPPTLHATLLAALTDGAG